MLAAPEDLRGDDADAEGATGDGRV
jgi:hypothetical protein